MTQDDENEPAARSAGEASGTSEDAGDGGIDVPGASGAATGDVETREETALRGLEDVRITATFERAHALLTAPAVADAMEARHAVFHELSPVPLADVARVLSGVDFAAEPSRAVLVEWQGPLIPMRDFDFEEYRSGFAPWARGLSEEEMRAFMFPRPGVLPPSDVYQRRYEQLFGLPHAPICKGSTKCKGCSTFRCGYCHKRRPWCIGASNPHGTWCDICVFKRHVLSNRRCWKCYPAGGVNDGI